MFPSESSSFCIPACSNANASHPNGCLASSGNCSKLMSYNALHKYKARFWLSANWIPSRFQHMLISTKEFLHKPDYSN